MTINDLTGKVDNGGVTASGKLSAEEWNLLVSIVNGLLTLGGHENVNANADGAAFIDYVLMKEAGSSEWNAMPVSLVKTATDSTPTENSGNAVTSGAVYAALKTIGEQLANKASADDMPVLVHTTQAAYDALTQAQKNDGSWYFIEEDEA